MFMAGYARNAPGVSVVSMSFGSGEFERTWNPSSWFDENQTDYDSDVFTTPQGHRPVSFVASAGDVGSLVEYPSTSPNVLAVGGTVITAYQSLTTVGKAMAGVSAMPAVSVGPSNFQPMSYDTETAWSNGGGGFSGVESRPAYQNGFNSNSMRSVPDVAYAATGFWAFNSADGGWETVSGTSCGAPQWAGLIALVNQGLRPIGRRYVVKHDVRYLSNAHERFPRHHHRQHRFLPFHGRVRSNHRPRDACCQPAGE